jgi:hypothetical protein
MTSRLRLHRSVYLTLLAVGITLGLAYFPISRIGAANTASVVPSNGAPLVHLQTPQAFSPGYTGSHDAVNALKSGHPVAAVAADFDSDGAMDIAAGYRVSGGGAIAILHGNPDALAPRDTSLYAKALKGIVAPTFQAKAAVFSVPVSPDFMATGDFNQDGYKDLLVAARGGALYFMQGDGKGGLAKPEIVQLHGGVTALSTIADGHVAIGTDGAGGGAQVVVLAPSHSGLNPVGTFPLTAPAASMAWGALGEHTGPDLAIASGDNVVIVYHAFHDDAETETVNVPFKIDALNLGDFIWDRDGRSEMALLADDGSIHILQHGILDTTPFTAAELKARGSLRAAIRKSAKSTGQASTTSVGPWTLATKLASSVSGTPGAGHSMFQSPRLTGAADLLVVDAAKDQLKIVDGTGKAISPETDIAFSSQPVAAVVMPQKLNGKRDLVVLTAGSITPTIISEDSSGIDPAVNTTADTDGQAACTNTAVLASSLTGSISLRTAICAANNSFAAGSTGLVTISLPAGTYTLTSLDTGELQPGISGGNSGCNITLIGAGATTTIIQQGDGIDRVFDIDPNAAGNCTMSISNVTIQNGQNNNANNFSVDGGGGMIDGSGSTSPDNLTLTNVVLTSNTNDGTSANFGGGGLAFEGVGSLTVTNSTISNNISSEETGGGIETGNENVSAGDSFTFTNDIFTGNQSTKDGSDGGSGGALLLATAEGNTASISGSTFTNNTAQDSTAPGQGGAINNTGPDAGTFSITKSRIAGNHAGDGSGLFTDDTTIAVTDNWWGCNSGPGAIPCDTVVNTGTGTFTPWLVLSISANPTQIHPTIGTSALTADLTHDSNGNSGFTVPNGTPLSFGATLGTISGASTSLTSGQGTATFNAGSTPGVGSATATVDSQTASVTIDVGAPPMITSGNSTTFVVGNAGSFTVTTTGDPTPSLSESGAVPSGLTFVDNGNGTATLSGMPAAGTAGIHTFSITAQNGFPPNATQSFTLTIDQPPAITSANNTAFLLNVAGTFTVTSTGFPTPALSESGALPNGVNFTDNGNGTATIAGPPSQAGSFPITINASNGVSPSAAQSFTLTVNTQLTMAANPAGDGTVSPGNGTFAVGQVVNISATPAAGFAFISWTSSPDSVANLLSPSTTITMNSNETVTANFQAFAPAVASNTAVTSSPNPSFTTAPNNSVTLTATVTSGGNPVTNGTVTFTANNNPIAGGSNVALNGSGQAQVTTSFATEGNENINAQYSGFNSISASFLSSSGSASQEVDNHTVQTGNQFCNPNGPTLSSTAGPATPYPSKIFVSGITGNISTVTVNLNNISSSDVQATDLLLVGPTGAALIPFASVGDGSSISGVNITLDDSASSLLPGGSPLTSGSFKPTSLTGATTLTFPSPAPTTNASNFAATDGTATLTSQFGATAPNGTWELFALASGANSSTVFNGGWCVNITTGTAPAITSANNTTFVTGTAGSFTVTTTGTPAPSLSESGALPMGVSFTDNHNGTATVSGPPTQSGIFNISITASNGVGSPAVQSFTLTVDQAPAITSGNSTTFTFNTLSSFTVTSTGFPIPSLSESGALPMGVSFTDNHNGTGTLGGTPTSSGTFIITLTASNGVTPNAVQSFTLNVPQTLAITSANNTTFLYGTASSFTVTTTGSPVPSITESGQLPSGIRFSDQHNGTATLTGTPTLRGIFPITFTASNGTGTVVQSFTLTVDRAPLFISQNNATFKLNGHSAFTVSAGGFPIPSIMQGGTLPNGVNFVDNGNGTGNLSGIATQSGTFPITFTASNGIGSPAVQDFTLTVAGPIISLNPTSINFGRVLQGTTATQTVMVTNTGTTNLNILNLAFKVGPGESGDTFTTNNECPANIGPGDTCNIQVNLFAGTMGMLSNTSLQITDNAPGSPHSVPLLATIINPMPVFQPTSLNFGTVKQGQSKLLKVTLTNTGNSLLDISSITITGLNMGDFTQTNNCPSALGGGHLCTIHVTFTPQATGSRMANLTVVDDNGTQNIPLSGTGD